MQPTRLHQTLDTTGIALLIQHLLEKASQIQRLPLRIEADELVCQCTHLVTSITEDNISPPIDCERLLDIDFRLVLGPSFGDQDRPNCTLCQQHRRSDEEAPDQTMDGVHRSQGL